MIPWPLGDGFTYDDVAQLSSHYRLYWFDGDRLILALREGADVFTTDGINPLRRVIAGTVDDPVYTYLVALAPLWQIAA